MFDRCRRVDDLLEVRRSTPTSLAYVSSRGSPGWDLQANAAPRDIQKRKAALRAAEKGKLKTR
jgi:hypothetical protein